ncbi:4Fe-4S binding protein [Ignicoccus hospitalis]|uniref:Putative nitrate reductase, subunit H n=1 Tax=Ignicoccus hospitalis (strain KIN4/I / DSM 18386 / JCM 14125) TaxID=453591 RepID=A8ACA1_IGNH4|nr:4Fe-4S binding protein [Ignicoccus hospitalis]ABU82553.1 putative nitrate reductase, subunit H [Ignicoccus hospitalis KIN4/I]
MKAVGKVKKWLRGRPPRGKWTLLRRSLQLFILIMFSIQLFTGGVLFNGSLASSRPIDIVLNQTIALPGMEVNEIYIPMLDPIAFLEMLAATHYATIESLTAVLVVVALYSVLGRFFCGWVCPMDLLFSIFEKKLNLPNQPRHSTFHTPTKAEKAVPIIALIAYVLLSWALGYPFYTTISPTSNASKLGSAVLGVIANVPGAAAGTALAYGAFVVFALIVNVVAEKVFGIKRAWCRFVCPIGALYGFVMNKYDPFKIKINDVSRCTKCRLCSMVCPMGIDVMGDYVLKNKDVTDYRCFRCGRCVEVCPTNVISLGFRLKRTK